MCARVSVLVKGSAGEEFWINRGLWQSSLLPPLLFNLVVEMLPILVSQFEELGWLRGIFIPGVLDNTTVLQYVDDTIIFS